MPPQIHNTAITGNLVPQNRGIRLMDAPGYLGMDRNRFNAEVRPYLTEMRYGTQCVCFDRLDLDAWFDEYKSRNGRPGQPKGELTWDVKERRGSSKGPVSGISTSSSGGADFAKALDRVTSKKQRHT